MSFAHELPEAKADDYNLIKVVHPRVGDKTIASTENLLSSLSTDEHTFSLEVVGSKRSVTLMHRSEGNDQIFRRQLFEALPFREN